MANKNTLGIEIPSEIEGFGQLTPYQGQWALVDKYQTGDIYKSPQPLRVHGKSYNKLCSSLRECFKKLHLRDGMTISFHHHLRGGDETILPVVALLNEFGIRDITIASSSLTSAHEGLLPYLENGTISKIWTSGLRGGLGKAVSGGLLKAPVIFHSHGGRSRAIESGKLSIDVAFIAASAADAQGNATGSFGTSGFGALGYSQIDSEYAQETVVLTDNLVGFPCLPNSIKQHNIDFVVQIDRIGDPAKIAGDTTRITKDEKELYIAELAAKAIDKAGYVQEGMSLQTGAGGSSLAVTKFIRGMLLARDLRGSFMLGGITSVMADMLKEGLFDAAFDVQSFDMAVRQSVYENPKHVEISSSLYANPFNAGCMTHQLDVVILAALEVDVDFNVNVLVGSDGIIRGASGGHSDAAAGADLTVIVAPSIRKGTMPIIRKKVTSVVTPGDSVDLVVTEQGICINPKRQDLVDKLKGTDLPILDIHELCENVEKECGVPTEPNWGDDVVALIEYRDGSIIDVVRNVVK